MARFSIEDYNKRVSEKGTQQKNYKVRYFKLAKSANPGEPAEAIVRFDYDNPSEFLMLDVHTLSENGRFIKINCLREHSAAECPFCREHVQRSSRFFAKVLQYVTDETGKVVSTSCSWDAPMTIAAQLNAIYREYAPKPLRQMIFKIIRTGEGTGTTYTITPANPARYSEDIYTANFDDFKDFNFAGVAYHNKSAEDMITYLNTGNFPEVTKEESVASFNDFATASSQAQAPNVITDYVVDTPVSQFTHQYTPTHTYQPQSEVKTTPSDFETARPRRTYNY